MMIQSMETRNRKRHVGGALVFYTKHVCVFPEEVLPHVMARIFLRHGMARNFLRHVMARK